MIKLDFDNEPIVGQVLIWEGTKLEWRNAGACSSGVFTVASGTQFVLEHGLNTEFFTWNIWRTDYDPIQVVIPANVVPSGANHATIELDNAIPGVVVFVCGGPQGQQGPQGEQGGVLAGVDSIEGLSGIVDLASPDGTVFINVNGQTIELTVLPDEGQTSVEGLSGVVDLDSPDNSIDINVNGQTIEIATSGVPDSFDDAEEFTDLTITAGANVFEEFLSLTTSILPIGRYRIGWHAVYNYDNATRDPRMRIQLDGVNVTEETRMEVADAGSDQRIHVGGFVYGDLVSAATHTIDMDFARTNGGDTFTIFEGQIEIWRVST